VADPVTLAQRARSVKRVGRRLLARRARRHEVEKFIFVVGYGRSGSTLVQAILGTMDGCHIAGENLGAVFALAQAHARLADVAARYGLGPAPPEHPWFGAFEIDPDSIGRRLAALIVDEVMRPPRGTRIAGFKEIRWLDERQDLATSLDFLKRYLAPARFVLNVRDPEAVVRSAWWRDHPRDAALAKIAGWNAALEAVAAADPQHCYLLRYEDFTQGPDRLAPLFAFLDESFDRTAIDRVLGCRLTHAGVPS
jgi:hypothetical protein